MCLGSLLKYTDKASSSVQGGGGTSSGQRTRSSGTWIAAVVLGSIAGKVEVAWSLVAGRRLRCSLSWYWHDPKCYESFPCVCPVLTLLCAVYRETQRCPTAVLPTAVTPAALSPNPITLIAILPTVMTSTAAHSQLPECLLQARWHSQQREWQHL